MGLTFWASYFFIFSPFFFWEITNTHHNGYDVSISLKLDGIQKRCHAKKVYRMLYWLWHGKHVQRWNKRCILLLLLLLLVSNVYINSWIYHKNNLIWHVFVIPLLSCPEPNPIQYLSAPTSTSSPNPFQNTRITPTFIHHIPPNTIHKYTICLFLIPRRHTNRSIKIKIVSPAH